MSLPLETFPAIHFECSPFLQASDIVTTYYQANGKVFNNSCLASAPLKTVCIHMDKRG